MAGVKGRSGGARPGAGGARANSGGARAGSGRKPKEVAVSGIADPLEFLRKVWGGEIDANPTQVRAAAAALPFLHPKLGEGGKKDAKADAAKKAAGGKFAAAAVPLKLVNR